MDQKRFARHLRQCQNTYEELLWQLLRSRRRCNKKFRRQHPIGIYTVDFYCAEERLIIEIDGRDHFTEQVRLHDAARDRFMLSQGIRVLRFTDKQVELDHCFQHNPAALKSILAITIASSTGLMVITDPQLAL